MLSALLDMASAPDPEIDEEVRDLSKLLEGMDGASPQWIGEISRLAGVSKGT